MIYTRNEAADILEKFEDVLISNGICVPSPEDDERDKEDMVGLYGSTYYDLLDIVEQKIVEILKRRGDGELFVPDSFGG